MDLEWERKVHQIVLAAQQTSPDLLDRYLTQACAGDRRLLEEVRERLEDGSSVLENVRLFASLLKDDEQAETTRPQPSDSPEANWHLPTDEG